MIYIFIPARKNTPNHIRLEAKYVFKKQKL